MIGKIESVTIFSQSAKKLAAFYRDTIGLKISFEGVMGENDEIYQFDMGKGCGFGILDHSEVKGKSKEPERIIINFEVDDIKKEVARLKRAKVRVKQEIYHNEGYGYIATFKDRDGNVFQLVQVKATPKKK